MSALIEGMLELEGFCLRLLKPIDKIMWSGWIAVGLGSVMIALMLSMLAPLKLIDW